MPGFTHGPVGDCRLRGQGGPVTTDPVEVTCPVCRFNYARWALLGNLTRNLEISPEVQQAYAAELLNAGRALYNEWTQDAMAGKSVNPQALQKLGTLVFRN